MDMRTNSYSSGRALASGIALFALAWSAAGQAQDTAPAAEPEPEAQSSSGISDIIVTATRLAERPQDVAVPVHAITGDSLRAADVSPVGASLQEIGSASRWVRVGRYSEQLVDDDDRTTK